MGVVSSPPSPSSLHSTLWFLPQERGHKGEWIRMREREMVIRLLPDRLLFYREKEEREEG